MTADMIITGARVLTMDEGRPRAEAVALAGGGLWRSGRQAEVMALAGPGTRVIDAGGRTLLPGFVESHLHLVLGGAELVQLQLGRCAGVDGAEGGVWRLWRGQPERAMLMAQGAGYEILDRPVTRHDLDRVIADRPIAMMSPDHHTVWANTAALDGGGAVARGRDAAWA